MNVIGIDLGTTNSVAAYLDGHDARIIPNDRGAHLTPSVVGISDTGEILVGESAKNQAVLHADRTITHVKRKMGEACELQLGRHRFRPEDISAEILRKLKRDAELHLGRDIEKAVITVPANFGEAQRKATIEAGRLAGLEVLRILNEPTAAALSYVQHRPQNERLLVYDLGGGTFDVTCLEFIEGEYHVRSSCGENRLGGLDFDAALRANVLEFFEREYGFTVGNDPVLLQQIGDIVERAKIELSSRESSVLALPFVDGGSGPVHLSYEVRRSDFDRLIEPFVERSIELTERALDEAGFDKDAIGVLVLAGGSTRIPFVQRRLKESLGLDLGAGVNPDEVVALGAALYGKTRKLTDVTSYALGVEIDNGRTVHLVTRNTPLPVNARQTVTTVADMQESVEIHVVQGDEHEVAANRSLGRFLLSGITPAPQGQARIEVQLSIDEDGIVKVSAVDTQSGRREHVTVRPIRDEQDHASSSIEGRVHSLSRRIENEIDDAEHLPADFLQDVQELLRFAERAAKGDDESGLREAEIALESLLEELVILREDLRGSDREHA